MDDLGIIALFWDRQERAVEETSRKYGHYCWTVAYNILRSKEDSEECVNDTWLKAWNIIPPQRPSILSAFLGKITRNLALDRYRSSRSSKRGGGQMPVALEELKECLPDLTAVEDLAAEAELNKILDRFLRSLPERDYCIFLRRYWYVDSMLDIAHRYQMAEGTVKSSLYRTRQKLKAYLEEEGVQV